MQHFKLIALLIFFILSSHSSQQTERWLSQLTLEEKISLLGGTGFATKAIPRLEIPAVEMIDGPLGVRFGQATAWPSGLSIASTFSPQLIEKMGNSLATEVKFHHKNMILGPTINIARTPWGGRTFESYGEDPYLAGQIAASYIRGVESEGVATCTKHFALNNQEWRRMDVNIHSSQRAMQEIYFPAFEQAVHAGTSCVMAAYNKVNDQYASENSFLINTILKTQFNFKGPVISDWGATHSSTPSALAGLDLEMPYGTFLGQPLLPSIEDGQIPMSLINDKVERLLQLAEKAQDSNSTNNIQKIPESHQELAKQLSIEGSVLLKNQDSILPLSFTSNMKIGVIGPSIMKIRSGGGSSKVNSASPKAPLEVLKNFLADRQSPIQIQHCLGARVPGDEIYSTTEVKNHHTSMKQTKIPFTAQYFSNENLYGIPVMTRIDDSIHFDWEWNSPDYSVMADDHFSVRWTGEFIPTQTGLHRFILSADDGSRLKINGKTVIDNWSRTRLQSPFQEGQWNEFLNAQEIYKIEVEYFEKDSLSSIHFNILEPNEIESNELPETIASNSDVVLMFVGTSEKTESEAFDREGLNLPGDQDRLIERVASINKNVVVIIQAGSPIAMPWLNKVKAVLYSWFPGSQGAEAMAAILFGEASPGGRLPITFPKQISDSSAYSSYPTDHDLESDAIDYSDDLYVGYRHFDAKGIQPLFPFGFGLTYSKFLSQINTVTVIDSSASRPKIKLELSSKNIGERLDQDVLFVFISPVDSKIERPVKELKFFQKFQLNPRESKTVNLEFSYKDFAYFDVNLNQWKTLPGKYKIILAKSASEIISTKQIELF